jgi:hypothetical protein
MLLNACEKNKLLSNRKTQNLVNLRKRKIYDQYGQKPILTCSFFIRAKEVCFQLEVDLEDVNQTVQPENIRQGEQNRHNNTIALLKEPNTLRIRVELENTLIYGRIKNGRSGEVYSCHPNQRQRDTVARLLLDAEAEAIKIAISKMRTFLHEIHY